MYLLNAFSANMLCELPAAVTFKEVTADEAATLLKNGFVSAVGHADTASIFASILGMDVPTNRISVALRKGDTAVLGQYVGPRLPEGATTLPDGATIRWMVVTVS